MARVVLTELADEDADAILHDLALRAGRDVAVGYLDRFDRLYRRLTDYPAIGAERPALGGRGYGSASFGRTWSRIATIRRPTS